ncbi:MAG: zinc ribbon domain-containing protein [Pyrinomonadaceae bacterium]
MMPETAIETAVCSACGAEVRDASLFCYSCGTPVHADPTVEDVKPETGDAKLETLETVEQPVSPPPPLRSAASLRKQRRAFNRQPVEVTWEPRTGSPVAFVITTIVLVIGALVFLLIALYLR